MYINISHLINLPYSSMDTSSCAQTWLHSSTPLTYNPDTDMLDATYFAFVELNTLFRFDHVT